MSSCCGKRGTRSSFPPKQANGAGQLWYSKCRMIRWKRWALALTAASAAALPLVSLALADALDPNVPHTVVVGTPKGAAPAERVDASRTGRTKTKLPAQPKEAWKRT